LRRASARTSLPIPPADVLRLWSDVERWPSFVEGFARRLELREPWPEPGGRVVWESTPDGRGRVTETVVSSTPDRFSVQVFEKALAGVQTLRVVPANDSGEGSEAELSLEYDLTRYGPLSGLADVLFIRRALRDSLRRTLYRFSIEAAEEARLS
jgi:Polyketide cyclase / dehydrase and lipid transport